jgi:outer membrane protein TolC
MRADGGTLQPSDAIEARRQAIDAERALVEQQTKLAVAYVALTKALGLGWGDAPAKPSPAAIP